MAKCSCHNREFETLKSLSNHTRWFNGNMDHVVWIGKKHKGKKGINKGENNGFWVGDKIGKAAALHQWVIRNIGIKKICAICGSDKFIDLANKTGIYNREFSNWEYLCRSCHMVSDGRLERLHKKKDIVGVNYI